MKNFILVQTGFWGNDTPIFSLTNRNVLFFKFQYIPPYEDLKKMLSALQIKERNENIFGDSITLALDVTEWLGKESDEFFSVIVKYLSDMSSRWDYILTVNTKSTKQMQSMYCFLRQYMQGELHKDTIWKDKYSLEKYLTEELNYSCSAASVMSSFFQHPRMEKYKSNDTLEKITQEILLFANDIDKTISVKDITRYIIKQNNIIHLILGDDAIKIIREITKEDICA